MTIVEREELKRSAAKLRQIATELREIAPSISTRTDALASDIEARVFMAERRAAAP